MSWIFGEGAGGPGWSGIAAVAPDVFDRYDEMRAELDRLVPTRVIALCRARMATLLGIELPDSGPAPDGPRLSELERAALDVAEQFTIDVQGIDRAQIDRLGEYLTPEQTLGLMSALWFEEALLRLGAVLGVPAPGPVGARG